MDLLLGGPGTGKTTALVNKIKERKPDHFALLSFTRQAAQEAKQRLSLIYPEKELDWIRTIHSLAFKVLRLNRGSMFTDNHLKAFGNEYGFEFSNKWYYEEDGTTEGLTEDDITYRQMQIRNVLNEEYIDESEINIDAIQYMEGKYTGYKKQKDLVDFNDILKLCMDKQLPRFDLLCIDEAQDLSPLQFTVIDQLAKNSKEVIYAGDDDQMIYEFAGVKRNLFMDLAEKCEKEILITNYRLPGPVITKSKQIIDRCKNRIDKQLSYNSDVRTLPIRRIYHFTEIERFDPTKSYLILARNNFFLKDIKLQLEDLGLKWSYLKHNGGPKGSNRESTNIKISTIHGSKGAEADVVILFTDVTNSTYQNITSDAEHRVFYVGMTRTRSQLIIVDPTSKYSYDL